MFQVLLNGKPYSKLFRVSTLETALTQFNKWCKEQRNCDHYITKEGVLGQLIWVNGNLEYELQEITNK